MIRMDPPPIDADMAARLDDGLHPARSPRLGEVVFAAVLGVLALAPASLLNSDGDAAHHLRVGAVILEQGRVATTDIFSHAHLGQPFVNWEWLAEAIFAAVEKLLGLNGVAILSAGLIAGTLLGLYRWIVARGLAPLAALLVALLATVASAIHWLARPHLFTFLLLLATVYLLEEYRVGRIPARRLAILPLLIGVWANLHPMFVYGLVLTGAYLGGGLVAAAWAAWRGPPPQRLDPATLAQARTYGLVLLGGAVASLVNPYGLDLWVHIFTYALGSFTLTLINEFRPPNFAQPITWGFAVLLVGTLAVLARTWRRVPLAHLLLVAAWTYLALQAARNIMQFSLLVPALLAPQLIPRRAADPPKPHLGFPWVFGTVLAILVLVAAVGGRVGNVPVLRAAWTEPPFPIRAVRAIQARTLAPPGQMFNNMTWGGYLLYTLYPRYPIFIDSQVDAYGEALNHDYLTVELAAPGWDTILDRYAIGWVIEPPGSRLVAALRARAAEWSVAYEDSTAVILVRR